MRAISPLIARLRSGQEVDAHAVVPGEQRGQLASAASFSSAPGMGASSGRRERHLHDVHAEHARALLLGELARDREHLLLDRPALP